MERKGLISDHIVDYLLSGGKEITDPVLQEWLDRNESNRQDLGGIRTLYGYRPVRYGSRLGEDRYGQPAEEYLPETSE